MHGTSFCVFSVIVLSIARGQLVEWMVKAKDMGMTSKDYVYIWLNTEQPTQALLNILTSTSFWDNDNNAKEAFKSLLVVSTEYQTKVLNVKLGTECKTRY